MYANLVVSPFFLVYEFFFEKNWFLIYVIFFLARFMKPPFMHT